MDSSISGKPIVRIEYCPRCRWMLRASYMAQEFLSTFDSVIGGVSLVPSDVNGRYTISIDDEIVFDRKHSGGFRDIKELKQLIRDRVAPGMFLGHSDKAE